VYRTKFIATKPHDISSSGLVSRLWVCDHRGRKISEMGCYNARSRGNMTNLTGVIRQLRRERQRAHGEMKQLDAALALP
jgi:hypothetical protein